MTLPRGPSRDSSPATLPGVGPPSLPGEAWLPRDHRTPVDSTDTIPVMNTAAEDLEAIRQLLARYCFSIDARDADAWAALFTEDGIFHYALGEPLVGRTALREFMAMVPGDRHHLTRNEIIELDGDRARVRAYALVTKETPPVLSAVGDYEDELVRTPEGWRFAKRVYSPH